MKKVFTIIIVVTMILSMITVSVAANDAPTAKITATLVGDTIPKAGEKFTIAISVNEISSGLFVSGEVILNWPAEVVSLADSYYDEAVLVTDDYCLGNIYNQKIGRTGKFEYISNFDRASSGRAAVAIYIPLSSRDQEADIVSDLTMFEISFMLNEGYTYDDFYLTLSRPVLFLTADKKTVSKGSNGDITVESIEKAETVDHINVTDKIQSEYIAEAFTQETESNIVLENLDGGLNADVNLMYNGAYYEAILKQNDTLDATVTITNSESVGKSLVYYLAEYDSADCLIELTAEDTITVPANKTVTVSLSKAFTDSNAAYAKIFLWEKGKLLPVVNDIKITAEIADYYGNTYSDANVIETNRQIYGVINVDTDVDIVKFQAPTAGAYVFKLSVDNGTTFGLYNSERNIVNAAVVDGNYRVYNLTENETYYIKASGSANSGYRIKPMAAENVTKNNGIGASLTDTYDCDLYEFTPEEAGKYIITAVGTDGVKASLYNTSFEKITSSETGDSDVSFRIAYDMAAGQTYYIAVEQKAGQAVETEYSLYVEEPFDVVSIG